MKKWIRFFSLGFFSHKLSKESTKRGYGNFLLGLILALIFLWVSFVGGDMLPFAAHYKNSHDFVATAHSVFANSDVNKRIEAEIENGVLKVRKHGNEYTEAILVNTFENEADKQNYSVNGYNVIIDTRPADTLAEIEAYCISNDGQNLIISYEEYLTLSTVARLNFDFKLKYTGNSLELNDEMIESYRAYVDALSSENKTTTEALANDLAQNKITKNEYNKAIYELYFTNYYPEITQYESESKVPLLRNYYYHQYITQGTKNYLFVFDDYMAGSFETKQGIEMSFYGFYSDFEDGNLISEGASQDEANKAVDSFIKKAYSAILPLSLYAYAMNVFAFIPFIALMPMVVTLLAYSIIKLRGVESISSLGAMFKIVGSFLWISSVITILLNVILAFFVPRNMMTVLPLVLFFIILLIRTIVFVVKEAKSYMKQLKQESDMEV